jgi:methylated-DNA-protein-cysteine methyltransferase-like protein
MHAAGAKAVAAASRALRYRRIYAAVAAIPRGCVSNYATVAALAGLPGRARMVGRALAECPPDIPWHRVVNAAGRIALPPGSAAAAEQLRRLRREGVTLHDGRIGAGFLLQPAEPLDALLWGPDAVSARGDRR